MSIEALKIEQDTSMLWRNGSMAIVVGNKVINFVQSFYQLKTRGLMYERFVCRPKSMRRACDRRKMQIL